MSTTPNMNLVLPVDKGSQDVWDTILDTVFTTIDSHDHTTGQGVKIPSAALNINADVSFATNSVTNLRALDFTPLATSGVTSYAGALFCNSADNELYWRTTGGTNVKLTAGASLNVAAFVGGIGGDYSAVGALLSFDDATDSYWLQQQGSPRPWAGMRVGNLDIYQQAALIVNRVRIMSPAALAASYALTLPAALPTATTMLVSDASGVLSYANTQTRTLILSIQSAIDSAGSHTKSLGSTSSGFNRYLVAASTNRIVWPIPLQVGDIITGYTVYIKKNTNNTDTINARIWWYNNSGTESSKTGAGVSSSANAPGFTTLTETVTFTAAAAGEEAYLVFTPGGGVTPAACELNFATVSITRAV